MIIIPEKGTHFTYVIPLLTKYVYLHNTFTYVIIRNWWSGGKTLSDSSFFSFVNILTELFNNLSRRELRDVQLARVHLKIWNQLEVTTILNFSVSFVF